VGAQAFVDLTDVIGNSRAQNGRFFGYVQDPESQLLLIDGLIA
jgi:hypothetical protein